MRHDRDHVIAGVFVLIGLLLGVTVLVLVSDLENLLERRQHLLVSYRLSDGLRGLKEGAPVTLGDQPVGHVSEITDQTQTNDAGGTRVVGKLVTCSIPKRYTLFENARIELVAPPLGSGTRLNIRSVGHGQPSAPGDVIEGQIAASPLTRSLARDMGIRDEQREQVRVIIDNVRAITSTLREDLPKITQRVQHVLADAEPLAADARAAAADLRVASADVRDLVGRFRERGPEWRERLDRLTAKLDAAAGTVHDLLADKDPALRETVDHVHGLAADLHTKAVPELVGLLETASETVDRVHETAQEMRALVVGQAPVLERMIANLQVTSGQLKLAAVEMRRSPWRLLYRPDTQELETDNLYDATRSFALAATALESAVGSLRGMAAEGVEEQRVQQTLDYLETLVARFSEAEAAFWQALGQKTTKE